jgi:hypothetical protein
MRRIAIMILSALLASGLTLAGLGCEREEGPAEKAGKTVDQSMEQAKEKTGETMEKAGEKMEETGEKMQEKTPMEEEKKQ